MAKAKSFEQNMQDLEHIVEQLENGETELEESLKLFEQGMKLAKSCRCILDKASQKVTVLLQDEDEYTEESLTNLDN